MGLKERFFRLLEEMNLTDEEKEYWMRRWDELNLKFGDWCYQIIFKEIEEKEVV